MKGSNLLATFSTNVELAGAVRKSIGSFIDDALQSLPKPGPRVVLETSQLLQVGYLHWWDFEFETDDRLSADLHGTGRFYADLLSASQFAKLHSGKAEYGMSFGNDATAHHLELEVPEDGRYYLATKRGLLNEKPALINVRWVCRQGR